MGKRVGRARRAPPPDGFEFEFHAPDFHVPQDVVAYTREKLAAKLRKFRRRIISVIVRLRDVNGPKGGPCLECHMEARLAGLEPVNVAERETDLRAALDVGGEALDLAVQRHVERARSKGRNQSRKIVRNRKLAKV
jgi:hypothetical protein